MLRSTEEINLAVQHVYVVVPVFNRIQETLCCIDCLKTQTYRHITIIVVDGGSTDDTPRILNAKHPDVIVLMSDKTLWWAGATRLGIDWALDDNSSDYDFVLMMNNDTEFDVTLVDNLVETSNKYKAVVGAVVMDADIPNRVIDGGTTLDWRKYQFSTVKQIPTASKIKQDCDVLPGRSTLIPIVAIRKAGNVNEAKFPHYIADYEFTYRLKTSGDVGLIVDYRARVRTKVSTDGGSAPKGIVSVLRDVIGRRSKHNVIDHLRFVRLHAPTKYRAYLASRILVAPVSKPTWPVWKPIKSAIRLFWGAYLVRSDECKRLGLDSRALCERGILERTSSDHYYRFAEKYKILKHNAPEVVPLYWRSWRPDVKLKNYWGYHSVGK